MGLLVFPLITLLLYSITCILVNYFILVFNIRNRSITTRDFPEVVLNDKVSDKIKKKMFNYKILYQTPVIFYITNILIINLNIQNTYFIYLSWIFVIVKITHSILQLFHKKFPLILITEMIDICILFTIVLMLLVEASILY